MVPLNDEETILDLIKLLDLSTIIVVKNELGCINSALTTIEVLRYNNIEVAGVIMNGESSLNNEEAIAHYGNVEVLDTIKNIEDLSIKGIKNYKLSDKLLKKLL